MPELSYGRAMDWLAERAPDRAAVVSIADDGSVEVRSRRELAERADGLARVFSQRGVGADDLVTIALPNGCAIFEAALATWKLGATPNPVSARLPQAEQKAIVETANPALVVATDASGLGDRPVITPDSPSG